MLLGFLDNLHRFTGEDVNKVAADLRAENSARQVPAALPVNFGEGGHLERGVSSGDLAFRVSELEKRLARQDKSLRQIASAFYDLLGFSSGPDSRPRG
mgnify:FL=1